MKYEIYNDDNELINTGSLHEEDVVVDSIIKTSYSWDEEGSLFYFTIFKVEDNRIWVK